MVDSCAATFKVEDDLRQCKFLDGHEGMHSDGAGWNWEIFPDGEWFIHRIRWDGPADPVMLTYGATPVRD